VRVIQILRKIIGECGNVGIEINVLERLLLYISACCHDFGMISGRKSDHERLSASILRRYSSMFGIPKEKEGVLECVERIILRHPKSAEINDLQEYEIDGFEVKLPLLCALFRLADALDATYQRTPIITYEILCDLGVIDEKSKPYWRGHLSIDSVSFDRKAREIVVFTHDECASAQITGDLKKELTHISKVLRKYGFGFTSVRVKVL